MSKAYHWEFPLPRTHTGMLLGNGTLGAMIWGEGSVLRITIGRADFWDHRGGIVWNEEMSYANIRECLESGNEGRLKEIFTPPQRKEGEPSRPSVLPIGRVELDFGEGTELVEGRLDLRKGLITITIRHGDTSDDVELTMDMDSPLLAVQLPKSLRRVAVRPVTSWEYVGETLKSISFTEPRILEGNLGGWVQECPADPALCVGYRQDGKTLCLTAVISDAPAEQAAKAINAALKDGFDSIAKRTRAWWKRYWKQTAEVEMPNERLQFLYDYGMYKFAGLTNPAGVPATLQGPWIEEYQMPPWSSDYHFNINVQMCYWPAYHGNLLEHLPPLFSMVNRWKEILRHNARVFLGIDDGLMLPHAVDDRGTCIGGFWSGSLDHGCTAWVAQMMYRYYRYTMNAEFLREVAYPFMVGAMNVYEGMLEWKDDTLTLPVSVSPEYHSKEKRSPWGRNASFQLACIHRLCEDLLEASAVLGMEPKRLWQQVPEKLPRACSITNDGGEQIAIWEGIELEESHRHHSHLAGLTPFDIFEADDEKWQPIILRSIARWIYRGPGLWSGWCVPWASMIHMRMGNAEAAELYLEIWQKIFTNEGHGTLHDVYVPGLSLMGPGPVANSNVRPEIMQMDAGMSATAAIQEMMLHTRRGVNYLFAGAPKAWKRTGFNRIRTDGAFLVSAVREGGRVTQVAVESLAGGVFKLANPWDGPAVVHRKNGTRDVLSGDLLEIHAAPDEKFKITAGS